MKVTKADGGGKLLSAYRLEGWPGTELNRRHADFQNASVSTTSRSQSLPTAPI